MQRLGQGHVSPMGQAHPRTGLLMSSDNPHRVQLYYYTMHIYTLHIFARIGKSSLTWLLSLPRYTQEIQFIDLRMPDFASSDISSISSPPYLVLSVLFADVTLNSVLSYRITAHASQFTNKLASDKMIACLAMKEFVFAGVGNTLSPLGNTILVESLACLLREPD